MKKFLSIAFLIIIVSTIVLLFVLFSGTTDTDDIWHDKMDIVFSLAIFVPIIFSELSIYFNCLYFFTQKDKSKRKTFLNVIMFILSLALLLSVCVSFYYFNQHELIVLVLFIVLAFLRIFYVAIRG